jgi:uncharacterized phiE125 gp8 family phage protein
MNTVSDYGLAIVTPPAEEPVSLTEAKAQCSIAASIVAHNQLLERLIKTARQWCESRINRQFCTATWDLTLDAFPRSATGSAIDPIQLPRAPLASVVHLKYIDVNGTLQTLATSDYQVLTAREPGEIRPAYGLCWPVPRFQAEAVQIRFTCGYGEAAAVPEPAREAMLLLVNHWFENRSPVLVGTISKDLELTVQDLLESVSYGDEFANFAAGAPQWY